MPRVTLVFPPIYDFALYDLHLKPFALLKLARAFEKAGYDVELVNALDPFDEMTRKARGAKIKRNARGQGKFYREPALKPEVLSPVERPFFRYGIIEDSLRAQLEAREPDIILLGSQMTYWYLGVKEAAELIKKIYPRLPLVLGGIYASLCPEHAGQNIPADLVVQGEADRALNQFLEQMGLPLLGPLSDYDFFEGPRFYYGAAAIRLNQGCPFRCSYCASRLLCTDFKPGNHEKLLGQIKWLADKQGARHFSFYDDALLFKKEDSFLPLLHGLKELNSQRKLCFYLPNAVHLQYLDAETARAMVEAGFQEIRLGIESTADDFHNEYDRKLQSRDIREAIAMLQNCGFDPWNIGVYLLAGLPGQNWRQVEASIRTMAPLGVRVHLARYSPVPHTELWERSCSLSTYPLADEPLTHNNTILPMEHAGFTTENMLFLKNLALELSQQRPL